MTTEWDRMVAGKLYDAGDPDLVARRVRAQQRMRAYNATITGENNLRAALLNDWLGCANSVSVRAPFYVDYGENIFLGANVFLNYGCILLDVCPIRIGDNTQIGPATQILTADHPREPAQRDTGLELGKPITIGRNVWIGGGALILPGVTIGDDAIVGAGTVVTRDVDPGITVAGNPARPLGLVPKQSRP